MKALKEMRAGLANTAANVGAAMLLCGGALAQEMPDPATLQTRIAAIQAKYQSSFDGLKADGDQIGRDMPSKEETMVGVSVGKLKRQDWYIRIPEFAVRQQTWFVKVPEFAAREQRWRFHVPEPCMRYTKFWGGGMHLPGICMREKTWFVKLPETSMKEQKWIIGVPEITMKEQHWILDLPEIKVEATQKRIDEAKAKGEEISRNGEVLSAQMENEIKAASREFLVQTRGAIAAQFDPPIKMIKAMLDSAPEELKADLRARLSEVENSRSQALKAVDEQIAG